MTKTTREQLMCGMSPGLGIAQWMNEKKNVTAGFGVYSIAEAWEWQRQLNRPVKNDNSVMSCL